MVDAHTLRVRRHLGLGGDFSVDAISPDGRLPYLIEYSRRNPGDYAVRAYDMRARRLLREPVVGPERAGRAHDRRAGHARAEPGWPLAYTRYQSAAHPFVHALDTQRHTTVCIDLDDLTQAWNATLALRGTRLEVVGRTGRVRAAIDTRTYRPISPAASAAEREH